MTQHATPECERFVKSFETCRLRAYADPRTGGEPWTCGWGSTIGVTEHTVWTQEQADLQFKSDIASAETLVRHYVTHPMTQGQFDAFVSIFQNVGPGRAGEKSGVACLRNGNPSTLLRKFNAGDIGGAEAEWTKWIDPGTSVATGLLRRRIGELAMFRRPESPEGEVQVT